MEEHLVPAVLPAEHHGHHVMKDRPGAARILCQELVPRQAWAVISLGFRVAGLGLRVTSGAL